MRILLASLFVLLNACGLIQDRSTEYALAEAGNPISIPAPLLDAKINSRYPIPTVSNKRNLDQSYELPKPPNATAALKTAPYMIETVDGQTWLRLYTSPGKIWPLLDFFWADYGVKVAREEISEGFMVTEAFELNQSSKHSLVADLDKYMAEPIDVQGAAFQAKLVQGVRRNTAELQIRSLPRNTPVATEWVSSAMVPGLEEGLLNLIGEFVTSDALQNRYSLLANDIGGESRVRLLKTDSGESYLQLNLSFQRAWNELSKALVAAGVIVSDIDVSERRYFVSYLSNDDITDWYRSDEQSEEKGKERNFSIILKQVSDDHVEVKVEILNDDLDPEKASELLSLVFEHIS